MSRAAAATRLGSLPRFSFATMYAPPDVSYASTVCRYDATTIASRAAMPSEIGKTRWAAPSDAPTSTTSAASVAYATEESGSEAKIGRASHFGSSVSSIWSDAMRRPMT